MFENVSFIKETAKTSPSEFVRTRALRFTIFLGLYLAYWIGRKWLS